MEVLTSPRRHLHPIMEENYNSAGEVSEDETCSNYSEYSENLFLSEDSLEVSDNERSFGDGNLTGKFSDKFTDSGLGELDRSGLSEYFISSLTKDANLKKESNGFHREALFTDEPCSILPPVKTKLQFDNSFDSADFSCDSLNTNCDSNGANEEAAISDCRLTNGKLENELIFPSVEKPVNTVNLLNTNWDSNGANEEAVISDCRPINGKLENELIFPSVENPSSDCVKNIDVKCSEISVENQRSVNHPVKFDISLVNSSLDDRTCSENENNIDFIPIKESLNTENNSRLSEILNDINKKLSNENCNVIHSAMQKCVSDTEKCDRNVSSRVLDPLESFGRDFDVKVKYERHLSGDSANWSVDSQRSDVIDTNSDGGFFESLNRSFTEMNENLQSIKQLSIKKFEDTLALRGYLENCDSFHALLEKYVSLKNRAEGIQTEIKLKAEMAQLKDDIIALAENVLSSGTDKIDRNELEKYINQMKKELECLQERKLKLTLVNLKVHQFKTESGVPVDDLKAEVAKLYQIWDYNYNRVSSQLESLQRVSNIWKQFEAHRNEFLSALGDDEKTIQLLDTALQDGDISPDIATSVRVVAKVLSEKRDDNSPPESLTETLSGATSLLEPCSGEGSLSDSGISDSGSEQDICEREKRLGEIRKLAKEMDLLSPGSLFAMDVNKRVQEMEAKLRELQRSCRNLIVKTAVCAETGCPSAPKKPFLLTTTKRCRSPVLKEGLIATADDGDDGNKPSQFWRILKCSMPFHLAIMLLVCVACLLEPHCCDSLNNFQRSIAPQMRYLYGPPPI